MARKKKTKKGEKVAAEDASLPDPADDPEIAEMPVDDVIDEAFAGGAGEEKTETEPAPGHRPKKPMGILAWAAILIIVLAVAVLAWHYFIRPAHDFVPGSPVDEQTLLDNFRNAQKVIVFMDVRGIEDTQLRQNILQCGVDFAGSSGLVVKDATFFSIGDEGCVTPDGPTSEEYCFNELNKAFAIYITSGTVTSYYSNGIAVSVGKDYPLGLCGIHQS